MGRAGNERKPRSWEEIASPIFKYDCYETPPWCVRALLLREPRIALAKQISDPFSGRGVIVNELRNFQFDHFIGSSSRKDAALMQKKRGASVADLLRIGRRVIASDIREIGSGGRICGGIDAFSDEAWFLHSQSDAFVINPPYNLAERAIHRCLELVTDGGIVAVFQRTQLKEGIDRFRDIWSRRQLLRYTDFSARANCYPEGQVDHCSSGQMNFGWYIFEKGHSGRYEGDWFGDRFKDFGAGALLPQQRGMCWACSLQGSLGCRSFPRNDDKALSGPMVAWLRENTDTHESDELSVGKRLDMLCGGWEAVL